MLAVALLCIGASLGALARWQLSLWLNAGTHWLPTGTLAANLVGGWLIGLLVAVFQAHPHIDPVWRLALVTGFSVPSPPSRRSRWKRWRCCSKAARRRRSRWQRCTWWGRWG